MKKQNADKSDRIRFRRRKDNLNLQGGESTENSASVLRTETETIVVVLPNAYFTWLILIIREK